MQDHLGYCSQVLLKVTGLTYSKRLEKSEFSSIVFCLNRVICSRDGERIKTIIRIQCKIDLSMFFSSLSKNHKQNVLINLA